MPQRKQDKDGIYKRQDSPYWWASFTNTSGKRARRSTGTADRREAEALLSKWRLEAHLCDKWDQEPSRTFDQLMLEYLKMVSVRKRDEGRRDRDSIKRLRPYFTNKELSSLKAIDVIGYIAQRREEGAADGTINKELGALSAALNWARRDLGWNVPNEVQGRKPKEPSGRIRWITRDEADALIATARQSWSVHLVDFILLGLHTGMRKNEMLKLEWRRVDLKAGLVYLQSIDQKNGRFGSVPLNETARAVLIRRARFRAEHCPDSRWVFCSKRGTRLQDLKKTFKAACNRAGIEDFRIHDLRHTCAAWLVQAGVPIREVAELLRHADIRITMRYAHLSPDSVRHAVKALEVTMSRSGHAKESWDQREIG